MIVLLSGGVGGAKLALGLSALVPAGALTIVANTGDDIEIYGVYISPDVDTLIYTLAGESCPARGWGVRDDTFHVMDRLERLGLDCWFRVGDRDFAWCLYRTLKLRDGRTPSEVVRELGLAMNAGTAVVPMTDARVMTYVRTDRGWVHFQEYLVKEEASPRVGAISFRGIEEASPSPGFAGAIATAEAVILAPSNPLVSIGPILAVPGVKESFAARDAPVVAVSPLIGRAALRGPLARMMGDLGLGVGPYEVARGYAGLVDIFIVDHADRGLAPRIEDELGMSVAVTDIHMTTYEDKLRLARTVLDHVPRVQECDAGCQRS